MNKNLEQNNTPATTPEQGLSRLNRIMVLLRENCPWDRKQTFETLRPLTIEEVFELSDAILGDVNNVGDDSNYVDVGEHSDSNSDEKICEELGDLIMHIAFYARVAEEQNRFTFTDILNKICDKLIRRHPHIFSDTTAETDEEVKKNWEEIKLKEKTGEQRSVLAGVPRSLPSMIKAWRIQDKARGVGFDWEEPHQVWDKVQEELAELQEAVATANEAQAKLQNNPNDIELTAKIKDELGDVFFALINYARFLGVNPDDALEHTNRKFIKRFKYLEQQTIMQGRSLHDMTLEEMNVYWEEAKRQKE